MPLDNNFLMKALWSIVVVKNNYSFDMTNIQESKKHIYDVIGAMLEVRKGMGGLERKLLSRSFGNAVARNEHPI